MEHLIADTLHRPIYAVPKIKIDPNQLSIYGCTTPQPKYRLDPSAALDWLESS